jgi:hypothetical protein
VTFLSPFSVEGDRFWSPKGDEKFTNSVKKGDLLVDKMMTKKCDKNVIKKCDKIVITFLSQYCDHNWWYFKILGWVNPCEVIWIENKYYFKYPVLIC